MAYENVQKLFKVEVDGEEVTVLWKRLDEEADPAERVFLRLTTESALALDPATDELVWFVGRYGDLLAEHLASYLADTLPDLY